MAVKYSITVVLIIVVTILAGCFESQSPQQVQTKTRRIDTPLGMIDYLNGRGLPALKSAEIWENDYGPGLKMTTNHYEVFTTLLEPLMLSQIPGFVESAYRRYNSQLLEPIETTTKFRTYLFADRAQWEEFTDSFAEHLSEVYKKIKAGAYYLNGSCVAYYIGRERTFSALGHEGWHQFNSRLFKYRLPSWLDEGIAMLFEKSRHDKGLFTFEPGRNMYRLGGLRKTLLENNMTPLKRLITINPGEVISSNQADAVTAFYSQAYALVRFLREDDYGKRLRDYHRMLLGGLDGTWPLDETVRRIAIDRNIPRTVPWNRAVGTGLFKVYIGDDFEQIEREYLAFCRKIVYHIRIKTQDTRDKSRD